MAAFLRDACATADLPGAAARAGLSLVEIRRYRGSDPHFDLEMATVDQSIRMAAVEAVRARAAAGDLKAIKALTDGTLRTLADEPEERLSLPIDHPAVVGEVLQAAALRWEADPRSMHVVNCPCGALLSLKSQLDSTGRLELEPRNHWARPSSLRPGGPAGPEPQIPAGTPAPFCPRCGSSQVTSGLCTFCGYQGRCGPRNPGGSPCSS